MQSSIKVYKFLFGEKLIIFKFLSNRKLKILVFTIVWFFYYYKNITNYLIFWTELLIQPDYVGQSTIKLPFIILPFLGYIIKKYNPFL